MKSLQLFKSGLFIAVALLTVPVDMLGVGPGDTAEQWTLKSLPSELKKYYENYQPNGINLSLVDSYTNENCSERIDPKKLSDFLERFEQQVENTVKQRKNWENFKQAFDLDNQILQLQSWFNRHWKKIGFVVSFLVVALAYKMHKYKRCKWLPIHKLLSQK